LTLTEPQKNFSLAQEGPNDSSDNMGGLRTFAALCTEVCYAGRSRLLLVQRLLTQHFLPLAA